MNNKPSTLIRTIAKLALAASLGWSTIAIGEFRSLLVIPGVDGNSDFITNAVDVESWSWEVSSSPSNSVEACIGELKINKSVDRSSTYLVRNAVREIPYPSGDLQVWEITGTGILKVTEIAMDQILVTSIATGSTNDDEKLTETVSLKFDSADFRTWDYSGGGPGGTFDSVVIPGARRCN